MYDDLVVALRTAADDIEKERKLVTRAVLSLKAVTEAWVEEANQGDGIEERHGPVLDEARAVLTEIAEEVG